MQNKAVIPESEQTQNKECIAGSIYKKQNEIKTKINVFEDIKRILESVNKLKSKYRLK